MSDLTPDKDPRNIYYYWGFLFLTSGLILITILPAMIHSHFIYPPDIYFQAFAICFFILNIIFWRYSPNTELYEAIGLACCLIFYSVFQVLNGFEHISTFHFFLYSITFFTGLLLLFSSIKPSSGELKTTPDQRLIFVSAILSASLVFIIILKQALNG